ncbi:Fc receptor-like protein 5 isoform X2 [Sardina pilchardus]|uniref:Fc receptor-like protein 5 isoform X2 n=1 Tax=Sardina pilchardus TaxID=27697 RepID=UPI002E13D253
MELSASYQLIWLILLLGHTEGTRPALSVSPHSWATEGDLVTLSCEVPGSSTKWTFLWYRAVPFRRADPFNEESPIFDDRKKPYYVELLPDSSRGAGGSYTLSPAAHKHTGSYVCRAEGGEPASLTDFSEIKTLWVTGLSPPASLVIRPNRTQLFYSESVSLSCEVQDKSTGWRLRWRTGRVTSGDDREDNRDCPYGWYSESGTTCRTSIRSLQDSGTYWCESESGQYSNAVNISINYKPKAEIRNPAHSWATEGDSVTLSCEVTDDSLNWTVLWYRAVRSRTDYYTEGSFTFNDNYYTAELLPDSSRGAGGSYTLSPAAPQHSGLYVCRAEGGDPVYQTGFSGVVALWVTGLSPPASLVITPNRAQLFESESLSLSCEVQDQSTGWRLRWDTLNNEGRVCPDGWGSEAGPACTTSRAQRADAGVYWCESESGKYSNALNVSIQQKPIPVLSASTDSWPAEGDSVTLSCEVSDTSLKWTFLWYRAVPYRKDLPGLKHKWINYNAELLPDSSRGAGGSYTLSPAALQHTGLYVCRAEGGEPAYQTDFSEVVPLWVTGVSPPASLLLRPNRALFTSESVSLSCEAKDQSSGWRLRWDSSKQVSLYTTRDHIRQCPQGWTSGAGTSCSTSKLEAEDRGTYWCESESGQHSNAVNVTVKNKPDTTLRVFSVPTLGWPDEGGSVTLQCDVDDRSFNWTILWYRAVPYRSGASAKPAVRYKMSSYSAELLPDSSRGAGGSYTLSPAALQHTGLYVCRAEGGDPAYLTDFSNVETLWVVGLSPPASLVIRPNRTQLFEYESVSLSCEGHGSSTGWRLRWVGQREEGPDCPKSWRLEAGPTCTTSELHPHDSAVYWCASESGEHSNPFKLRSNLRPRAFLRVSPHSWPVEGDSVTLNCEITDTSLDWTFLWYRAVPIQGSGPITDGSTATDINRNRYSVELLPDSSRGAGGSYTLSPATLQHTGLYVCRAEGGDPAYLTMYSDVKPLRVIGLSPPATLVIRPSRTALRLSESVSLSCEVQDKSAGWRLRWETNRREESVCPASWRSEAALTCSTSGLQARDRGVYWCESESGQHSNAAHITIQ